MKGKRKFEVLLGSMYGEAVANAGRTGREEQAGVKAEGGNSSHHNGRIRGLAEAAKAFETVFGVNLAIGRPEEVFRKRGRRS